MYKRVDVISPLLLFYKKPLYFAVLKQNNMMGLIEINGMEFFAYHGCYDTERVVGNKFLVDVTLETDCTLPAQSDNIQDALNYVAVYEVIAREMMITSHLLEHVARRILDAISATFPQVQHITLKVAKLNPPLGGKITSTSVTLHK